MVKVIAERLMLGVMVLASGVYLAGGNGLTRLDASTEMSASAGACCLATPSAVCTVCTVLTSCTLGGGGTGSCTAAGNADGCQLAGTRRVCGGFCPYTVCVDNSGAAICGSSFTAPVCVIGRTGGFITSCTIPATNTCRGPVTVPCQHCT